MSGKNAGKFDICFYHHCPGAKQQKRGWLRAFLIGAAAQGRRFGSAGALGWAAAVPRAENFIQELHAERMPRGGGSDLPGCWMVCTGAQGGKLHLRAASGAAAQGAAGPEPGSSSPFRVNSCSLQVAFFPGSLCACWPALS